MERPHLTAVGVTGELEVILERNRSESISWKVNMPKYAKTVSEAL